MKFLLALLLLIPSLSWGSEEKARELYVKAKTDLMKNGCNFELLSSRLVNLIVDTYPKSEGSVENMIETVNEVLDCGKFYKENTMPIFDKIINDYPSTEVAYDLISSDEYVNRELLEKSLNFLEQRVKDLSTGKFYSAQDLIDIVENEPMTISEIENLTKQLQSCLKLSSPITDFKDLKPVIYIKVNPDRTVRSTNLVNKDKLSDPNFRVAAEAAERAINSPECYRLDLPPNKYEQWKEINFTFDFSWMYE